MAFAFTFVDFAFVATFGLALAFGFVAMRERTPLFTGLVSSSSGGASSTRHPYISAITRAVSRGSTVFAVSA